MKLVTKLTKGSNYRFDFRVEVTSDEMAAISRAGLESHRIYCGGWHASVRQLLDGHHFECEDMLSVQAVEVDVQQAAQQIKYLLQTVDRFGETKEREI